METAIIPTWPDSQTFWRDKRVTVTGGAGFLGCCVVETLRERGATEIFVPRQRDYDLVQREAVLVLFACSHRSAWEHSADALRPIFIAISTPRHVACPEKEHGYQNLRICLFPSLRVGTLRGRSASYFRCYQYIQACRLF